MIISVNPDHYRTTGDQLYSLSDQLAESLVSFYQDVSGTWGMAGSDPQGIQWAVRYDQAAKTATDAVVQASRALVSYGTLLHHSGYNRAAAASMSCVLGPQELPNAVASANSPNIAGGMVPSAAGSTGIQEPEAFRLVQQVGGYIWPDGNSGLLEQASAAWSNLGASIENLSNGCKNGIFALVSNNSAPEIDLIEYKSSKLVQNLSDLAGYCRQLAASASSLARGIAHAHDQIYIQLGVLAATIGGSQLLGAVLDTVTFGGATVVATVGDEADIAETAGAVEVILVDLGDTADAAIVVVEESTQGAEVAVAVFGEAADAASPVEAALAAAGEGSSGITTAYRLGWGAKAAVSGVASMGGQAISQEVTTGHLNGWDIAVDGAIGAVAGGAMATVSLGGISQLGANMAADGAAAGATEAANQEINDGSINFEEVAASTVTGAVAGGIADTAGGIAADHSDGFAVGTGDGSGGIHLQGGVETITGTSIAAGTPGIANLPHDLGPEFPLNTHSIEVPPVAGTSDLPTSAEARDVPRGNLIDENDGE